MIVHYRRRRRRRIRRRCDTCWLLLLLGGSGIEGVQPRLQIVYLLARIQVKRRCKDGKH